MISAKAAKKQANAHFGCRGVASCGVHCVQGQEARRLGRRLPRSEHPDEMLIGGALVVTDEGEVHAVGSTPDALDLLMEALERSPHGRADDVWSREGEGLALLADEDPEEAAGLAAWAASRRPWPDVLGEELSKPYFRESMRFVDRERRTGAVYPSAGISSRRSTGPPMTRSRWSSSDRIRTTSQGRPTACASRSRGTLQDSRHLCGAFTPRWLGTGSRRLPMEI